MERLLLIDTDAGVDDAIAIFLCLSAHKNPETKLTIVGITCVSGNTYVDNVCINVTRILNAAKVEDVPVFKGCESSMIVPYNRGTSYHGSDGFGDAGLPVPIVRIERENAVLGIIRLAKRFPEQHVVKIVQSSSRDFRSVAGELSILALGPLTNLAMAFRLEPTIIPLIKNICHMGGNIEAVADPTFNFKADPEAASVVFSSVTTPVIIIPYEICKKENIKDFRQNEIGIVNTSEVGLLNLIETQNLVKPVYAPCDPLAAAVFLEPKIIKSSKRLHIRIDLASYRGQMIIDHSQLLANADVIYDFDVELYKKLLKDALITDRL